MPPIINIKKDQTRMQATNEIRHAINCGSRYFTVAAVGHAMGAAIGAVKKTIDITDYVAAPVLAPIKPHNPARYQWIRSIDIHLREKNAPPQGDFMWAETSREFSIAQSNNTYPTLCELTQEALARTQIYPITETILVRSRHKQAARNHIYCVYEKALALARGIRLIGYKSREIDSRYTALMLAREIVISHNPYNHPPLLEYVARFGREKIGDRREFAAVDIQPLGTEHPRFCISERAITHTKKLEDLIYVVAGHR